MSVELWKHALGVGVVEIPSQNEEGIRVGCLLVTDVLMELIQCLTLLLLEPGGDVYCHQQYGTKFPRQVEWPAFNYHTLRQ